ncbi:hypothetical protein BDN71DRAFT_1509854 [Pleurotus eryngii]|uniref:Uncharacterized protein n=1 Tax=Pleurotus eryngii TaxID=5323 RepID=A0A9P6D468_PLEER|nr:hypothetical protein BDN71DRAFT_1509854 [Pleurotus eryngii]
MKEEREAGEERSKTLKNEIALVVHCSAYSVWPSLLVRVRTGQRTSKRVRSSATLQSPIPISYANPILLLSVLCHPTTSPQYSPYMQPPSPPPPTPFGARPAMRTCSKESWASEEKSGDVPWKPSEAQPLNTHPAAPFHSTTIIQSCSPGQLRGNHEHTASDHND